MKFELTNDRGEVVLAAESDCTWNNPGNAVYTVGDPNMLTWLLNPKYKDRWHIYLITASGSMLYNAFTRSAYHYNLRYTGDPSQTKPDIVHGPDTPDLDWKPARPVYTGKLITNDELNIPNNHLKVAKSRLYILESSAGNELVRATLEIGQWHDMVNVIYEGDVRVLKWAGSPAEPRWVYSFFKDAHLHSNLNLTGPDKDEEPTSLDLPPGWEFIIEE